MRGSARTPRRRLGLASMVTTAGLVACAGPRAPLAAANTGEGDTSARAHSVFCYPPRLSAEAWERLVTENPTFLPPTHAHGGPEFVSDATVWVGEAEQGPSGRAQRAQLTYSFPPDGTIWGLAALSPLGLNDLNARLVETFPVLSSEDREDSSLDLGREYIRQALAAWEVYGGVTFEEVADDGSPMDEDVVRSPDRGDLRIGGFDLGGSFLAYNAFPSSSGASLVGGSDMALDTSFFDGLFALAANDYRFFRHTVAHELGHGLGYIHVGPCGVGQVMEPFIPLEGVEPLAIDERRGVGRNYGDRFAGNHDQASAQPLGPFLSSAEPQEGLLATQVLPASVIERDLTLNGASGFGDTNEDWFRFVVPRPTTVTVTVEPAGGTYQNGHVGYECSAQCDGASEAATGFDFCPVAAQAAGDLALELRSFFGIIEVADGQPAGNAETITRALQPGTYFLRVEDRGPNPSADQIVQLYDLTVRFGNAGAAPRAVAGIDKRVAAGSLAFFMGHIHSRATEPGRTIVRYDWDLDGDGVFETKNRPLATHRYDAPDDVLVTLRVTDSAGRRDTDTIRVTVY